MNILSAILIFSCLHLAALAAPDDGETPYQYIHRPRLGYFNESPFIPLYEMYAKSFIMRDDTQTAYDDSRYFAPDGDECVMFFTQYKTDEYVLRDLPEFILLDACLGYLFQEHRKAEKFREVDAAASSQVKRELPTLMADPKLKATWEGTTIKDYNEPAKECIATVLYKSVQAKNQFSNVNCNEEWLQIFLNFAHCHDKITADKETDTYLQILYGVVKARAHTCFFEEIHILNQAVQTEYINNPFYKMRTEWAPRAYSLLRQGGQRKWPKPITKLLKAAQGTDKQISLRRMNALNRGVAIKDKNHITALLRNMAAYANVAVKNKDSKKSAAHDPTGRERYKDSVDKLCNFFRPSDNAAYFDFASPFVKMVEMIKYEDIFGIDQDTFIDKVLCEGHATAPLYLAVSTCNILTFTEGYFEYVPHHKKTNDYKVKLRDDLSGMVIWPDAGSY